MSNSIAQNWRLLSGEKEWEGLLHPLDTDLRHYIIHYGERVQAVYDCFINEPKSKNIGLQRYAKRNLFSKVGLEIGNPYKYNVKKYFYASTNQPFVSNEPKGSAGNSNWLGYVAVTTDEGKAVLGRRDILISFRGTLRNSENHIDAICDLVSASRILGPQNDPKVHRGWYLYYTTSETESNYNPTSCRDQILATVKELVNQYKDEEVSITVTGHSLGGAMATLCATDIVYNEYNKPTEKPDKACLVTAIVFGSPRVGNGGFHRVFCSLHNLHSLRVRNKNDAVPDLPENIIPEHLDPNNVNRYVHVGKELVIDTHKSPYLKVSNKTAVTDHVLEVYLHGVAGTQGKDGSGLFELKANRDLAVINKSCDGLKDEYGVVAYWLVEKNKSMVQMSDGKWVLMDHEVDDDDN
ncbi:hypothetical protein FNV43_RR08994 [Rhamnella rubrinervis]|uniref:Phospholipase A1 n=1 Tax=Rhamnella rubrinervis TaxID=2594499 RepID=A0A8K0MJF4_9ROSA|nr:hypothetical protein FNV43_RR08994 [Rhamnella rubrinervis]